MRRRLVWRGLMDAPGIPGLRSDASTERAKSRLKSATRAVRLFPGPVRPTIQTIAAPIVCIGTLYASKSEPLPLSIELEIPDGEPISPLDPPGGGPGFLSRDWFLREECRDIVVAWKRANFSRYKGIWFRRESKGEILILFGISNLAEKRDVHVYYSLWYIYTWYWKGFLIFAEYEE